MKDFILMGVWLAIIALLIYCLPFVSIWSINTLFSVGIGYTFESWLAMVWVNLSLLSGFTKR